MRLDIATRSLQSIARTDPEGFDDVALFSAAEQVSLPGHWWDLVDATETVVLCGPEAGPDEAGFAGARMVGVRARARFR